MKEYRKVLAFTYKNNKYNMYLDKCNKHFFLKVDNKGNLHYITTKELLELLKLFTHKRKIYDAKNDSLKEKIKIVPKIINGGMATILSLSLLTSCVSAYNDEHKEVENIQESSLIDEKTVLEYISNNDLIPDEEATRDTYFEADMLNYLDIYDMDYLNLVYDDTFVNKEQLYEVLANNKSIAEKYKKMIYNYIDSITEKYPNACLKILYENLKTIEIIDVSEEEIADISHEGSLGCYDIETNKMYMLDYYTYDAESWQNEIFYHELSHALRSKTLNKDGKDIYIQFEGRSFSNNITSEALNSLFAVSLLDYEEDDITYQLQSNYFNIMLDCMDNYDLSDYVNHSSGYFASKLDEFNNDDNYAAIILELMQMQYEEYHGIGHNTVDEETNETYFSVDQEQYYPIYDYLSKMYFDKYIKEDMTYDEMQKVVDSLIEKISLKIPEEYNIDFNRFYDNLNTYCNKINNNVQIR